MKQSEILDLLLKGLYDKGKDNYYSLGMIINEYNIPVETIDELRRLAKRLENDGLIAKPIYTRTDISAKLSSYGIDYCEGDSYTYKGSAIITNNYHINVENCSDTTIVNQSDNVKLSISKSAIKLELSEIINAIKSDKNISGSSQQNIIEKIDKLISKL